MFVHIFAISSRDYTKWNKCKWYNASVSVSMCATWQLLCLCTFYLLIIFCLFLAAVCVVCMCTTCHHALHSLNKRKRVITWPGRSRACSLAQTVKRPNCRVDSVLYCVCIWVCVPILFVFRKSNWELKHCSKNAITKADMHVLYLSAKCFKSVCLCVFRWRNIKLQNTMFEYTL